MQLGDHDLNQLDEDKLLDLPEEALRRVSIRLLNDLKEVRERLKQNSRNSSWLASNEAPWDKARVRSAMPLTMHRRRKRMKAHTYLPLEKPSKIRQSTRLKRRMVRVNPANSPVRRASEDSKFSHCTPIEPIVLNSGACCGTGFKPNHLHQTYTGFDIVELAWTASGLGSE
ncbi:hypothetical protein [Methylotuvimicrobium alcaliphilum]|uniref:hypothetical protein n=1 Tax=Methylotuvimicrobium alcaliphilum TaxID=271065 RepID=UPI0005FBFEB7|nr:hypothetical protein [Methylotuvimicrobium alcaliphilum]